MKGDAYTEGRTLLQLSSKGHSELQLNQTDGLSQTTLQTFATTLIF